MTWPIRWRLALGFAGSAGVLIAIFGIVLFLLTDAGLRRELKKETRLTAQSVRGVFDEFPWSRAVAELTEESQEFGVVIRLVGPDRNVLFLTKSWTPWDWAVVPPRFAGVGHGFIARGALPCVDGKSERP